MSTRPSLLHWFVLALGCMSPVALADGSRPSPAETAQALFAESGVQGGLVVHLGCGDGKLTAALRAHDGYLVHGLDRNAAAVAEAREHVRSLGLYGSVSIEQLHGARLPYTDNLVNLLVVDDPEAVAADEIERVLAPQGVAMTRQGDGRRKTVKPRPENIGRWTHYLHGPDNNAVTDDEVFGEPYHLQWVADPAWARSHEHLANISALVSCGRRIFYVVDEGPTALVALDPDWQLVARDAFSGVVLWKRPLGRWEGHLRGFRSGPPELTRRLVAADERLFVTLGYGEPLSALDPATGEMRHVYEHTDDAIEVLHDDGVLYVVRGKLDEPDPGTVRRRGAVPPPRHRELVVLDAATGKLRWKKADADTRELMPVTLTVAEGQVLFHNPLGVVCLDAATGEPRWRAERPVSIERPAWSTPTLVAVDGVVLSADRKAAPTADTLTAAVTWQISSAGGQAPEGEMIAFSAETGERLWDAPCREAYNAPVDVLVVDGLVWSGYLVQAKEPGITVARDLHTGEVVRRRPPDQEFFRVGMVHHRCYRNKATSRFLVLGRSGVELVDMETGEATADHWVRGACQYGVMPANGLLYAPTHPCACFIEAKLNGFNALAPRRAPAGSEVAEPAEPRLLRGPAYDEPIDARPPQPADWPTYRHNAARSGATDTPVPSELGQTWETELGGPLSTVVVAEGKVWVAQIDAHTLHALDADTGEKAWRYTVGGRIDSPPTIWQGRVLFGAADGWVYCLRADDGRLAWRFRAAPEERRMVAYDQLESVWPLHGNVLVNDGVAFAAAGRSSFTDGGIRLVRLDARSGELLSETRLDDRDPETGHTPQDQVRGFDMPGFLPDVLSSDGRSVFMRQARFDLEGQVMDERVPHLFSQAGFLDDSWWHRTYWIYGEKMHAGWGGWPRAAEEVPSGRLLVHDGRTIYGFGRTVYARHGSHAGLPQMFLDEVWPPNESRPTHYRLFATPLSEATAAQQQQAAQEARRSEPADAAEQAGWRHEVPLWARAMVLAGDTLLVAGPPDPFAADDPTAAWGGEQGGLLQALSVSDGQKRAEFPLTAPPVFDGMAAANGRLYLATVDGRVVCIGGE